MKEIVDQLINGQYYYAERKLDFSTPRVEISLCAGEVVEGSFTIFGPEGSLVVGKAMSTDMRMQVITKDFSGTPYEVSYRFNSSGLSKGDVLLGDFRIISNQGEYFLPFVVNVKLDHIASSLGDIRNLFHFANLAKTDWKEAVDLFYSREFISAFSGKEDSFESLYRGLSEVPGNEQNVEEFLISINKKQPMGYIIDQKEINMECGTNPRDVTLTITRNGWGYTYLSVKTDNNFIAVQKSEITEDDFSGSVCRFKIRIRPDRLHDGNNYSVIKFENAFTRIEIPVTVAVINTDNHPAVDYQARKKLIVDIVKLYEDFSCKKITSRAWLSETGKLITKMNALDENDIEFRLYTAHYYITSGRVNEGKWILDQAEKEVENTPGDTLYSYFLYLSTLCSREEGYINDVYERLEGIFRRNTDNWRIAWLIFYMSEEYNSSSPRKWMMLEEQFSYGCRSPFLYIEALSLLNETPSILTRLEDFELYVLEYGAKKGVITLNLIDQIVYQAVRVRDYNARLFRVLRGCYEIKESDEILEAIITLLIKGTRVDDASFEWYEKGVERELRITRLYEYYMMAIHNNEDGTLPCEINKMVLMYFSYHSDLEYDKNAILYRYVHEHSEEYPDLFESYKPQIEKYLMAQLDKGRISRDLGYLYKNLLTRQMVDASNASKVLNVLYTSEITTADKRINSVIVVYDKCEREMRYPMTDGCAFVPLYGSDYCVLLADHDDNRYSGSIAYNNVKMMIPGKLAGYAIPYIQKGKENLDLFLADLGKNAYSITMDNVGRYRDLAASELVREKCRKEIRNNLIRFYYDNDFTRLLTEYLMDVNPSELSGKERNEILELIVMAGLYDKALDWVKTYGTYGIDPKTILRLCSRMIDRKQYPTSDDEIEIAFYAFSNGKYDEQLLSYLVWNFNGTLKEMRNVWKAAEGFGLDTYALCERMLIQMLYTGSFVGEKIDIFKQYVHSGGGTDVERAFLTQSSYDSFVLGKITDRFIFERIEKLTIEGISLQEVCKLAYLRYYATEKSTDEEINEDVAVYFLKGLMSRDIHFPFYKEYEELMPDMVQFADKTMLEYRTTPGSHPVIHFRILGSADSEYKSREMREMYDGIYVTSFVLFFGEQLQYYITEERGKDSEVATESGTISKSDIVKNIAGGRYSIINDIMIGETLQDYETVDKLLSEYYTKKNICYKIFTPCSDFNDKG
ncbi:DUF5717 family protein [Butyrivibrio sp. YAB3001]|uniref:DUF5717 family protein n=1 Tax=Butyrivibrio sp. YAB3001 TaxID=1520812 RepID=UPI0008F65526|nr:DUF5717 family protein [Butyrivibrio sp. YAB3001]SFC60311.1 hypothetical protein SAMN02910398_02658 [Butyrivibrio sp. YAB3001]